jgi:alkylhydroperoxidase family enzyme
MGRSRPATPRIEPVGPDEPDERIRSVRAAAEASGSRVESNMYATFLRNPDLQAAYGPFGEQLRNGQLPTRDRELAILRSAWNCAAAYEWGAHMNAARAAGLTDAEIERVPAGPDAEGWAPFDEAILRAADELHFDACITDETWRDLSGRYSHAELIEFAMLVGNYHLIAFVANSAGVQPEVAFEPLPDVPESRDSD